MKKKGTALLLSLFLFVALSVPVLAARGDVYDQAGLFNGIEADQLLGKAEELSEKWERDFVVVTASDTEGKSTREYADDFYDEKGYGTTGKNSGVLFSGGYGTPGNVCIHLWGYAALYHGQKAGRHSGCGV